MIFTILHVLGVVIGMGGAIASDLMFFASVRDEKISRTEVSFLKLGGKMVWLGLVIIVISGIFLVLEDPQRYLSSSKFLAKMTIVAILIINGIFFHLIHLPRFYRHAGFYFPSSDEFMRAVPLLVTNGTISLVSWFSTFLLGMLKQVNYSYGALMIFYFVALALVLITALVFRKLIIPHSFSKNNSSR